MDRCTDMFINKLVTVVKCEVCTKYLTTEERVYTITENGPGTHLLKTAEYKSQHFLHNLYTDMSNAN